MPTPHVHRDLIIAWADGAEIDVYCSAHERWEVLGNRTPTWSADIQYRIKPKPVTVRYRVALTRLGGDVYADAVMTDEGAAICEGHARFVRWLTDWQEVEA